MSASSTWSIRSSTKRFFSMFARHIASGSPVVADCAWTNASGVCAPLPSGQLGLHVEPGGLLDPVQQFADGDLTERGAGARGAAQVPLDDPAVAWSTSAMGSPVRKWETVAVSRLSYGFPQRRTGSRSTRRRSLAGRRSADLQPAPPQKRRPPGRHRPRSAGLQPAPPQERRPPTASPDRNAGLQAGIARQGETRRHGPQQHAGRRPRRHEPSPTSSGSAGGASSG